jgi:iron complex outermembrane receptor protein
MRTLIKVFLVGCLAGALLPETSGAADTATSLDEIVVTARKRAENLQDVPDAISAFTAQQIEAARIENIQGAMQLTPNVQMFQQQEPGVFLITIRGITQAQNQEAPVDVVIDGVTLPFPNSFTQDLYDIERIEILRGPQGALYGQNAIGGAINITTKAPTNEFESAVKVTYGRGDDTNNTFKVSGPIVPDMLLFDVGGFYHYFGGLIHNGFTGQIDDRTKDGGGQLKLLFTPTDIVKVDLRTSLQVFEGDMGLLVPTTLSQGSGIPGVSTSVVDQNIKLGQISNNFPSYTTQRIVDVTGKVDIALGFATLTSISGYEKVDETLNQDIDVSQIAFVRLDCECENIIGRTQELRLVSPDDQRLRWIVGGFAQDVDNNLDEPVSINLNLLTTGNISEADANYVPFTTTNKSQILKNYAEFAQASYKLTDQLDLTVALRHDKDERTQNLSGFEPGGAPITGGQSADFEEWLPKAQLSYKATSSLMYYATFSEGFRPGGFNAGANPEVGSAFPAEKTYNYEVGLKSEWLDRRLLANAAVFFTNYLNQQFTLVSVTQQGVFQDTYSADKTQVKGAELEVQARPVAGLDLGAAVGYQDAIIKSFGNALNLGINTATFEGKTVPLVSRYNGNLTAQYTAPITPQIRGFARTEYILEGPVYWNPDNVDRQGSYGLVNMRMGIEGDSWTAALFGNNVFDKHYYTLYYSNFWTRAPGGFDFAGINTVPIYGVEFRKKF